MYKCERKSIELTREQWENLEAIAMEFDAVPPTRHSPSWRTLIKLISKGDLIVTQKKQSNE